MIEDELAALIATSAGRLLLDVRDSKLIEGKSLGAAGDAISHEFITKALAHARPADAVLSEEGSTGEIRARGDSVWIVDPLDGTREFAEGRSDWAVHVALVVGNSPVAAAVALPACGETLSTAVPPVPCLPGDGPMRILVSRTRPPKIAEQVAGRLGGRLVPMGSAGAKAMAVIRGEAHAYLHAGGQYEWDSAAPAGVALAAGLHVSRLDGSPLCFNQADPLLPDLLVCHREVAEKLLDAIASAGEDESRV